MEIIMKKIIASLLVLTILLSLFAMHTLAADGGTFGDSLSWSFAADGTLTISGSGAMPDLDSYANQPWRSLAISVKKITVSEGITSIGANSFAMMPAVSSVYIPNTLKIIGSHAFEKCYALTAVAVPTSVTRIENGAFSDCWQLAKVNLASHASYLTYIGDEAFAGCSALHTIALSMRLTHIGDSAFMGCSALDGIDLPDKLSYLGRFAFQACTSLTSVNVPWQIKNLPDYVFFGCSSLESVTFGRYLESIGKEAFLWCSSLKEIHLPLGVTDIPEYSIGYYYFDREFIKYDGLTVIAGSAAGMEYAAKNGFNLVVDDPSHACESPCPYCFLCTVGCEYLTCYEKCTGHTFPITGKVTESISWSLSEDFILTLEGTGELPDFTYDSVPWDTYKNVVVRAVVGEGITSVGAFTFDSHTALREVSLPHGVTRIGRKAFSLCTSLGGIDLPDSVAEIGNLAFNGCSSLEYVFFGDGTESIGSFAFFGCVRLLEAILPEGASVIGDSAFEGCPMLESFYVPDTVSFIGNYALGYVYSGDRHFYQNENFTIKAPLFSEGHAYAVKNALPYERTDTHECSYICEVCARCLDTDCLYPECTRKCDAVCTMEWDDPFSDVREADWFADSVRYVYLKGLFTGMTNDTFAPSGGVTRAQLTVVLWRLAGSPAANADAPFEDNTAAWYRDAVSWAYETGVVTGKTQTTFDPMGKITREQMVTMLMRFYEKIWKRDTSARGDTELFADSAEVSAYAADAVSWALAEGLVTGKDVGGEMYIAPLTGATRAECATIFARLLKK